MGSWALRSLRRRAGPSGQWFYRSEWPPFLHAPRRLGPFARRKEERNWGAGRLRRRRRINPSSRPVRCSIPAYSRAWQWQHGTMFAASARRLAAAASSSSKYASQLAAVLNPQRGMHDRNKKAMELVAKGWSALQEVDRVIKHADFNDKRLIPQLRGAKENFELALEIDNMNTKARYWLGKMHFKYHVPGACKAVGAALLVEAANMGDSDAQYELGCRLRVENDYVQSDDQAFHYLEQAVDQLHPGALYLLGAVYLTGDCVKRDIASAMWCFHRASEKGHAGAAIAYGSLLLKGVKVPEVITRFNSGKSPSTGKMRKRTVKQDPIKLAKEQFQIAVEAGCDLGLQWLKRLGDYENQKEKLEQIQQ